MMDANLTAPQPFEWPVFGLADDQKAASLGAALNALTHRHAIACAPYGRILRASGRTPGQNYTLETLPFLPVRLFKQYELASVPQNEIFKVLTSSGTTSQQVSHIVLDRDTADAQTKALVLIMQQFIGKARLPMLIVDHPGVVKNRASFSARGAGILGFANFGRDHVYALREEDMTLDIEAVEAFLARHAGKRVLIFGFTFMIWKYLYQAMRGRPGRLSLPNALLIHGGGWKKLHDEAVDNETFKSALRETFEIGAIHNFYGMVEQVGSVFVECEHGHLHAPAFADVLIRDPYDWSVLPRGKTGLIQMLSVLPSSYPGHSVLTEDLGEWTGLDDCRCGRLGRTLRVHGRVARAELRGCSDTHAASVPAAGAGA